MTEEDFSEYAGLLKRVHGNFNKLQHCCTTAGKFGTEHYSQAVRLIDYGIENFPDSWFAMYTAYLTKGIILTNARLYADAYRQLLTAKEYISDNPQYLPNLSVYLVWALMHKDGFAWSEELEEYYREIMKSDDIAKGFVNTELRITVAEIIIAVHNNDMTLAMRKRKEALKIISPLYRSKLQNILDGHGYTDKHAVTKECRRFLKKLG